MKEFVQEFASLDYILDHCDKALLICHNNPDADSIGSVFALKKVLEQRNKEVVVVCNDPFPESLLPLIFFDLVSPKEVSLADFDVVIACDSPERGPFSEIQKNLSARQVSAFIDHHLGIELSADVIILDTERSSTCEIVYEFFEKRGISIDSSLATALLLGIMFDTGNFQHACTSNRVLEIASILLKKGAPLSKIIRIVSSNKNLSTLRLWGRAFEKMRIVEQTGMAVTAITQDDLAEFHAHQGETSQIANILSTIPGVKYGLVLHQKDAKTVRGSFRAQHFSDVDLSQLAKTFGGGGLRLASGFELPGVIKEKDGNWVVE